MRNHVGAETGGSVPTFAATPYVIPYARVSEMRSTAPRIHVFPWVSAPGRLRSAPTPISPNSRTASCDNAPPLHEQSAVRSKRYGDSREGKSLETGQSRKPVLESRPLDERLAGSPDEEPQVVRDVPSVQRLRVVHPRPAGPVEEQHGSRVRDRIAARRGRYGDVVGAPDRPQLLPRAEQPVEV